MADSADALLLPGKFTWNGKTYLFSPLDALGVRSRYQEWMQGEAWADLRRQRKYLTAEEYQAHGDGLRRDITGRLYDWGTDQWMKTYQSERGRKVLLLTMIQERHPDFSVKTLDAILEDETPAVNELGEPVLGDDGAELTTAHAIVKTMLEYHLPFAKPEPASPPPPVAPQQAA